MQVEEEDEEEEAVWLREQGHCKNEISPGSSVPGLRHWLQQQQAREAAGGCRGGTGERAAGVFVMAGKRGWCGSLGRAKEGAGVSCPEGCYTITVRRHGARMSKGVRV